jgi:predicted outer membrane repeat protein
MHFEVHNSDELVNAIHEVNRLPDEEHTIHLNGSDSDYVVREPNDELFGATAFPIVSCKLTIQGNRRVISRPSNTPDFRFFGLNGSSATLTLRDITLSNGSSGIMGGGAVVNDGDLILEKCIFTGNQGMLGGAIYNGDMHKLVMRHCLFIGNEAFLLGGAIYCSTGSKLIGTAIEFHENTARDGASLFIDNQASIELNQSYSDNKLNLPLILTNRISLIHTDVDPDFEQTLLQEQQKLHDSVLQRKHSTANSIQGKPKETRDTNNYQSVIRAALIGSRQELQEAVHTLVIAGQFDELKYAFHYIKRRANTNLILITELAETVYKELTRLSGLANLEACFDIFPVGAAWQYWKPEYEWLGFYIGEEQSDQVIAEFVSLHGLAIIEATNQSNYPSSKAYARLSLLLYLIQHLVIRGVDCENLPAIAQVTAQISRAEYREQELLWLPFKKMNIEDELVDLATMSFPDLFFNTQGMNRIAPASFSSEHLPAYVEIKDDDMLLRICRTVEHWARGTDQRHEARIFSFDIPLAAESVTPPLIQSLGLDCLQNATNVELRPATPNHIVEVLFFLAFAGGFTSLTIGLSERRIRTWQSLSGLVGASKECSVEEIERLCMDSLWFEFRAFSDWYNNDFWDVGILVVRPDRHSIAILTATFTD